MALRCLVVLLASLMLVNADDGLKDCTSHIKSCCDLRTSSPKDAPDIVYTMNFGTFASARVYCDMTTNDGGWMVIQRNRNGSQLSFNKNWKEYEDGFGDLNEDFWAGLKLMNVLTQRGQWELRVDFQNNDNSWSYLHYNQFSVGSTSEEYRLTITGYTGISGDYFTAAAGDAAAANDRFTTYDNVNDVWVSNCALRYKCGWWFSASFDINSNHQPPISDWPTTVLFMEMKIPPRGCAIL